MDNPIYSKQFVEEIALQNYPVRDMLSLSTPQMQQWTGLPLSLIEQGMFDRVRDINARIVNDALKNILKPWVDAQAEEFPSIQVLQVARMIGISPEAVIQAVQRYPPQMNGFNVQVELDFDLLKGTKSINDCQGLNISAKKILRDSRYLSRAPGGGPVQKAALAKSKIVPKMKLMARERARITFTEPKNDFEVMPELEMEVPQKTLPLEDILANEPFRGEILQVMDLLKAQGYGNKWILGQQESLLAQYLVKLSQGVPCDFLIWNCIGFTDWEQGNKGKMPACNITTNERAAITRYFQQEIIKLTEILSTIGDPTFTILLPTNEAFDPNVWNYKQPPEEREQVMDDAVRVLQNLYAQVEIPQNARISVKRWDRYLQEKGALKRPDEYSALGYKRLMESADREKIQSEATRSGKSYYGARGINVRDGVLAEMQMRYYGVYAGEGVVFEEFQNRGDGIVVLNFEEFRCAQNAFRGAGGNLAVVTPITDTQMKSYYQWEESV